MVLAELLLVDQCSQSEGVRERVQLISCHMIVSTD